MSVTYPTTRNSDSFEDDEVIQVSGNTCGYPTCVVQITNKKMLETLEFVRSESVEDTVKVYAKVKKALRGRNVAKLYRTHGKAWDNLCDDIIIFCAIEYVMFGKPIPICLIKGD